MVGRGLLVSLADAQYWWQCALWSSAACKTQGPSFQSAAQAAPSGGHWLWHFLGYCKSEWRLGWLGLVTVGTIDLVAEQGLKPIVYRTFWPRRLGSAC